MFVGVGGAKFVWRRLGKKIYLGKCSLKDTRPDGECSKILVFSPDLTYMSTGPDPACFDIVKFVQPGAIFHQGRNRASQMMLNLA